MGDATRTSERRAPAQSSRLTPATTLRPLGKLLGAAWLLGLGLGALAIAWASRVYFDSDELAPFVIEKLPLPHEDLWLGALKIHVATTSFALPACLLLSLGCLRRFPRLHRWLGRATGAIVLAGLVPSGLYLSLFAKGGAAATVGFGLSGLIVSVAMVQGVRRARAKDYVGHRRCALHVLAQLSVAVTSRALLNLLDTLGINPEPAYLFALWIPVLASSGFVEARISRRSHRRNSHAPKTLARRPVSLRPSLGSLSGARPDRLGDVV